MSEWKSSAMMSSRRSLLGMMVKVNGAKLSLRFFSPRMPKELLREITIYPTTDNVDGEQVVYIDNIQMRNAPKVGDVLLGSISDGSLDGNIKLTGAWLKGECQNADGDWQKVRYNDFATLAGKLKDGITSIDMRGTTTKDVDVNAMRGGHSNVLVFADEAYDANNIVANEKCANLVSTNAQPFATPENFTAASVSITRPVLQAKTQCACLSGYPKKT